MMKIHKKSKQYKITIKNASIAFGLSIFLKEKEVKFSFVVECLLHYTLFNRVSPDFINLKGDLNNYFNYYLNLPSFFVCEPLNKIYLIRIKPDLHSLLNTHLKNEKITLSALINNFFDSLLSLTIVENTLNTIFWGSWVKTNASIITEEDKKEDNLNTEGASQLEKSKKNQNNIDDKTAINREQNKILIDKHQQFLKWCFVNQTRTQFTSIRFKFSAYYEKNFKAVFYENMKKALMEDINLLYPNYKGTHTHFLICLSFPSNIKSNKRKIESKKLPMKTCENHTLESNPTDSSEFKWVSDYEVSVRFLIVHIGTMRYTLGKNGKNTANIVSLFDDFDGLYPNEYPHIVLHQPWFSKKVFDRLDFSSIQTVKRNAVLPLSATKQYKVPDSPLFPGDIYISIKSKPKSPFSYNKKKNFFSIGNKGNDKDKNATHCGFIFSFVDVEKN